jgi:hypothetical protein
LKKSAYAAWYLLIYCTCVSFRKMAEAEIDQPIPASSEEKVEPTESQANKD